MGVYGRPVSRIPDTGATVGFMEARAYETLWTNEVWGTLSKVKALYGGELSGWHQRSGRFNLGYADGHVAFPDMGLGTFYEHIGTNAFDVRGSWGRLDCLPDKGGADIPTS